MRFSSDFLDYSQTHRTRKKEFNERNSMKKNPNQANENETSRRDIERGLACASLFKKKNTKVCWHFEVNLRKIIFILCNLCATELSTQTAFSKAIYSSWFVRSHSLTLSSVNCSWLCVLSYESHL